MRDDDVLSEYLSECEEKLDKINLQLTKLEKDGFDRDVLRSIARDVHTVKGSSQLFGFNQIGQVTHSMEDCLERLRDSSKEILPDLLECLYKALDVASKLFKVVKLTKDEPPPTEDVRAIVEKLEALAKRATVKAAGAAAPQKPSLEAATTPAELPVATAPAVAATPNTSSSSPSKAGMPAEDAQADTIRVHVDLLDNLMNLVGELVLIRNQLGQVARGIDDENLARVHQRLNVVAGELQNDVMKTRMQPIGNVLNKFQRVVRDMAKDLGKRVELDLSGTETELDKTLIEAVRDPLMHIVRNAVDHGIELPEDRRKAGKREGGTIAIRAFHEGGQVIVEIRDDGKGLNRDKIAAKAVDRGLVSADSVHRLSERDIFQFIFLPGFSTAEKVSSLSGRGVGMDVVRTNIEKIGGAVDLASVFGQGTVLTLKIPLTLAIIPALIVQAGGDKFAIPQVKLVELLRIEAEAKQGRGLELLQGRPVFRLRGDLLPLVSLAGVLKIDAPPQDESVPEPPRDLNVAVLNVDRQTFGLVIDAIDDSADIVVKPLASFLKDIGAFSGATILGDGSIALTLDISGIASLAQVNAEVSDSKPSNRSDTAVNDGLTRSYRDESTDYLLVDVDSRGKYALPLVLVNRLEEFQAGEIRLSGEQRVVKYRDSLLPLLSVRDALGFDSNLAAARHGKNISVVVIKRGERHFGLEVDAIIDVIMSSARIDMNVKDREGIIGSLIEGENVIALIDALGLIDQEIRRFNPGKALATKAQQDDGARHARRRHQILLAEDGAFFRRHVTQILEDAGYHVRAECDGERAMAALESEPANTFSVIVSDIEMPLMTGLEFVQKVRASAWKTLPMVALTSRFSENDISQGLKLGFTRYLEKLNPDELLCEIDSVLGVNGGAKNVG